MGSWWSKLSEGQNLIGFSVATCIAAACIYKWMTYEENDEFTDPMYYTRQGKRLYMKKNRNLNEARY